MLNKASVPAAGIIRDRPFLEHTEADFKDSIDVNVNYLKPLTGCPSTDLNN
jgi:hypothetical protein